MMIMHDNRTAHQKGNRNTIVEDIRKMMLQEFKGKDISAACLYWAKATCMRLRETGQRAIIQAGSASWTRVPPELDDGEIATHYGYQWTPNSTQNVLQLINGDLPEMHVWAALPERNQVIDITTGFQADRCKETLGMDWLAERPPDWMWCEANTLPDKGAFYVPCRKAIDLAMGLLRLSPWGV